MPPRRSSRSTRASEEPAALPAKRKRGQATEPAVEESESTAKPPSKVGRSSARSSSVSAPKTRVSTRGKTSLPDVAESEAEEESDALPARKKSRPSRETAEESNDEGDEAEVKSTTKKKGRQAKRTSAAPASNRSIRSSGRETDKLTGKNNEESEEDALEGLAVPDGPVKRNSRIARKPGSAPDADSGTAGSGSDVPEAKPKQKKGRKAASRKVSDKRRKPQEDKSQEDEIVKSPDPNDGRNEDQNESEDELPEFKPRASPKKVRPSAPPPDEEEEERSLFEPAPPPSQPKPAAPPLEEPSGPKSRLIIHKMALVNFKSYAGRQVIGPFHKSFSAIVGPNGSGKSNTIDALLFVFGYRASKMRQAKLSELIHNSDRHPDLQECSVEVHFREIVDLPGPDAFEYVPNSDLVVARQAFKNNSSRYTINGRSSNYTEVQTLLKGRGIDLDHKRFLILQGEVESIAQMKAKATTEHEDGLLEYLEDIIGTSKYKEPIDEALVEMERLQEDRSMKLNRLRLVEKEKAALEEKKREAEEYLRLKNDHTRALSRLWQFHIWQALIQVEKLETRMDKLKKDLDKETEDNKDEIAHLQLLQEHYADREKAYAEVQAAQAEAVKDLAVHERKEINLQERKKHAVTKAKKLKKTIQDDTASKTKAMHAIEDNAEKMEREKGKLEEYEASLAEEEKVLESIQDSLRGKTQVFHDQIEVKQKELEPWKAKMNAKKADIDVATSERDALAQKAEALKTHQQEAQQAFDTLKVEQQTKVNEQESLRSQKSSLQREIKEADSKSKNAQIRVQECQRKASAARQKIDEAKASQADSRSQNKVLDSLTRLQATGRIQGFHGRLGSLGTIPDKYDVAVSTACGSLNHMVVDTVDQAQACIQYLRSQNIGRATFVILEKTSNRGMEPIRTPEDVPRLFDLIKPKEPRFAHAFYKGLSNTLVAKDMEQATRIAYGERRWRVVTLAGQLIDTSGTMSGGGSQPARGGMSSKLPTEAVQPELLAQYERDSQNAAKELEEALQAAKEGEAELDRLTKLGPTLDMSFAKLGMEIETNKKRIMDAEKRLKELTAQNKPNAGDVARIAKLDEEIATATEELEKLESKASKIGKAIQDLEKQILDIGGSKLLTQKSKVEGLKLHINLANDEMTKAEVAKAKAEKDVGKLGSALESNTALFEEAEAEIEVLNGELGGLQQYVAELRAKVEDAQVAADEQQDNLDSLKAQLAEKEEKIQGFRKKEAEIKQSIADAQKEHKENEKKLESLRTEHDKLSLEEIDDEEDESEANKEADKAGEANEQVKVKEEPDIEPTKKAKREKTPSDELHVYSIAELSKFKSRELIADAEYLDEQVKNARPDLSVLKEYKRREEEFLNRAKDLDNVTQQRDTQKQEYDRLRKQRLDEFMSGFNLISLKLKEMYQMITLGGNAELELVDSMDPFSEGIIFSVMPPKKSWKNISNLSGGEKTLSSLALVFALHVFKPTPLYFMDEIDAALDFRNVSIVANYIKDRTKNAQFIIISLRNDMFELSHRLIGIYKTSNQTRSISIDNQALTAAPRSALGSNMPSTPARENNNQ